MALKTRECNIGEIITLKGEEALKQEAEEDYKNRKDSIDEDVIWEDIYKIEETKLIENCGDFINDVSTEIKSYVNLHDNLLLHTLLTVMSTILGTKVMVTNHISKLIRVNLWTILVGDSGVSAKSTTYDIVYSALLEKLEKKLHDDYMEEKKNHLLSKPEEIIDAKEPILKELTTGSGSTFEGVMLLLSKNPHGILNVYDEGAEFLRKMNKNPEYKASYTGLYEQKFYKKHLVGKESKGQSIYIENPFISTLLISNTSWFYTNLEKNDFISGYLNRFTIVEALGELEFEPFKNTKNQNFCKFQKTTMKIWDYLYKNDDVYDFELSKEAKKVYKEWFNNQTNISTESALISNIDDEAYNATLQRQRVMVFKYATIIQIFDTFYKNPDAELDFLISEKYINIAIAIVNNTLEELERILRNFKNATNPEYLQYGYKHYSKLAEKVYNYLHSYRIDKQKKISSSALIKNIHSMTRANEKEVIKIAIAEYNIKKDVIQKGYRDISYYYLDFPDIKSEEDFSNSKEDKNNEEEYHYDEEYFEV